MRMYGMGMVYGSCWLLDRVWVVGCGLWVFSPTTIEEATLHIPHITHITHYHSTLDSTHYTLSFHIR